MVVGALVTLLLLAQSSEPPAVQGAFIMSQTEDGKVSADYFEVWDMKCVLVNGSGANARCAISAVSLVNWNGETHLTTWQHTAQSVREVAANTFRIELNGRLSECSGLSVIMRVSGAGVSTRVESIEGDMRAGSRCQSRRTFSLDRSSARKAVAPLQNPAYRP